MTFDAGGVFAGTPAAAQNAVGDTFAVALDTYGGALYIRKFSAASNSWNANWVVANGIFQGSPSAAVDPNGTLWFAARDNYNAYYLNSYTEGVGLGGWINLGGIFTSDPVISVSLDGIVNIVGKDSWNAIYLVNYHPREGAAFWTFLGATAKADCRPSILAGTGYELYVAIRDQGDGIWIATVRDSSFSWVYTGGVVATDPELALAPSGVYIAGVSSFSVTWYRKMKLGLSGGWAIDWKPASGVTALDAVPATVGDRAYIVVRQAGNLVNWYDTTSETWQAPVSAGINSPLAASPVSAEDRVNTEPCSTCFGTWSDDAPFRGQTTIDRDWSKPVNGDGSFAIMGTVTSAVSPGCTVTWTVTNGTMLPIYGKSQTARDYGLGDRGGAKLSYTEANPNPSSLPASCGWQPEQSQNINLIMTNGGCDTMRGTLRRNRDFRLFSIALRKDCQMPELNPTEITEDGAWDVGPFYGNYAFFGRINSNYNFQGRTVRELTDTNLVQKGTDGCWFSEDWPKFEYPTGGEWFIGDDNMFDVPDSVGWNAHFPLGNPILHYRQERPPRGLPIPCTATLYQTMVIFCNAGGFREYKNNVLNATIDSVTITNSRDTNFKTSVFPY